MTNLKKKSELIFLTNLMMFSSLFITLSINLNAEYKKISNEEFSCKSNNYRFSMSPDGTYLAIMSSPREDVCDIHPEKRSYVEDEWGQMSLSMMTMETMERKVLLNGSPGSSIDPSSFAWLSDERFVYEPQAFNEVGRSINALQTFAMNADGSGRKALLEYKFGAEGLRGFSIYNMNSDDDDTVYVFWNNRRPRVPDMYKLNIKTGVPKLVARGPDLDSREVIYNVWTDKDGMPEALMTDVGLQRVIYTYDVDSKKWSEHYRYTCQYPHFTPVVIVDDEKENKRLWLVSGQKFDKQRNVIEDNDTNSLYLYDPETKEFSDTIYKDDRYDVGGYTGGCRPSGGISATVDPDTKKLTELTYVAEEPKRIYFDDLYADEDEESDEIKFTTRQLRESLESLFPNDWVALSTTDNNNTKGVFRVYNSNNPGDYYYFDLLKGQVFMLYQIKPWLDRDVLVKKEVINYKARDGLMITAYLSKTKKKTDKNYLVILPHGGPNVKEGFGYDGWTQFFANRGYNVLQPDYRGSTGYGRSHYMKGNRQWGKAMQDDLTDGVLWAIENGYADADRVCIAGGSYGGYAAMAGAVFTPDLYRCVINFVGVADMRDLLKGFGSRSSRFNTWEDEGRLEWGSDKGPGADKYISEISPLLHVKNIKAPVLISHGSNDYVVPVEHARSLRSEMDKYGKTYEWHMQAYEGHGFFGELANLEHYDVQEAFLKRYLEN